MINGMQKNKQSGQAQIEGLATLLILSDEVKKINNLREFGFFATNETYRLMHYHSSYLFVDKVHTGIGILAQSGAAEIDPHAITNQWLVGKLKGLIKAEDSRSIKQLDLTKLAADQQSSPVDIDWRESFPRFMLWCPFVGKDQIISGGMLFFRETPFKEPEIKMMNWLIASYQYTWQLYVKPPKINLFKFLKKKPVILFILLILCIPIRQSVLGEATVVSSNPVLINSPIDGVIDSFSVSPGQNVKQGQVLLKMDTTDLQADVVLSNKQLKLTQAKLRTAIDQGRNDAEISAEIPILKAQIAIDKARITYTKKLLQKTTITSPINGIVVFGSKEDWISQPVRTGERIMEVTNPKDVQLKIMIPITNMINLKEGADGDFFRYGSLTSIPVQLKTLGYNAKLTPSKILAYEMSATFTDNSDLPQLGSQGTAKLYGSRVPLFYYLIKRPLQAVRQRFGI